MIRSITIVNVVEIPFWDLPGGEARLAHDLCHQQVKWGYRVYLVGKKHADDLPEREVIDGITVLRLKSRYFSSPDPRNMLERLSTTRRAVRQAREEAGHIDVLHTHTPLHGAAAMKELSGSSTLKVHSIHSPWLMEMAAHGHWTGRGGIKNIIKHGLARRAAGYIEGSCFRRADFITSDSEYTRTQITRDYPGIIAAKDFRVLPGWVDTERFRPDGPRTDWTAEPGRRTRGPVFFTVRGLVRRNGLDLLVSAASILKKQGLEFEVVIGGGGALRAELEAQIEQEDAGDRVKMIGRIDDDRLPSLYRSCDAFVLPTVALECFGIIILEALASGKPVIATPVGAIPELLAPIFPEGLVTEVTAPALADGMKRFIQGAAARSKQGDAERFRRYARDNYSIDIGTGRFRKLYESGRDRT